MRAALQRIEALLRRYGYVYQANLAELARQRAATDPEAACRALDCDEWWGDGEAIAALDLALAGGFSATARADGQALRRALLELHGHMREHDVDNEIAALMAAQFHKWLASNA